MRHGQAGTERHGLARRYEARLGRRRVVPLGVLRRGEAELGLAGNVRIGAGGYGEAGQAWRGKVPPGEVEHGIPWPGMAPTLKVGKEQSPSLFCYANGMKLLALIWRAFMSLFRKSTPAPVTRTWPVLIEVVNRSTVISDATLKSYCAALQIQVERDFAPLWGIGATVALVAQPSNDHPWVMFVMDDSDVVGALGYHDFTPTGQPVAKVFAKTDQHYGLSTSVTMSHELLEMLGDAGCDLTAQASDTQFVAYEACDPVEDDSLGYQINGVQVSDFVTPAYFMPQPPSGAKFDFMNHVHAPFTIAPGGYLAVWDPTNGWGQATNGENKRGVYHQTRTNPVASHV